MGCCYSFFCKEDSESQNGEPNERTHLLVDPTTNNSTISRTNRPVYSDDLLNQDSNTLTKQTDEQSALNKILQETATNVIDVAALDSHNLQVHEFLERSKQYRLRMQQISSNCRVPSKREIFLLKDTPNAEQILSKNPISNTDVQFVEISLSRAVAAINEIKVEHKEDLVVLFRVP